VNREVLYCRAVFSESAASNRTLIERVYFSCDVGGVASPDGFSGIDAQL